MPRLAWFVSWILFLSLDALGSGKDSDSVLANQLERICPAAARAEWFSNGTVVRHTETSGWGVYADRDIEKDAVVARIPLSQCVNRATMPCDGVNAVKCKLVDEVYADLEQISNDAEEITLAILVAMRNDPYSTEIRQMARVQKPIMSPSVLEMVVKPLLPQLYAKYRIINVLLKRAHERVSAVGMDFEALDDSLFAVTSRSFALPLDINNLSKRTTTMIPCGDLFNHDITELPLRYFVEDDHVIFKTRRLYKRGEELRITYGTEKSAEDLFFQYGFFVPESKGNKAYIWLGNTANWGSIRDEPITRTILSRFTHGSERIPVTSEGLLHQDLALLRTLALKPHELSAYTLAEMLGRRAFTPNKENEMAAAVLLSNALIDTITKFKDVFESNRLLLDDDDDNKSIKELLLIHLRILAAAWKRVHGE